jgi:hypothetical protein
MISRPALDDEAVSIVAKAMIEYRYFGLGPQAYVDGITTGLAQETPLADAFDTPHSEEQFREFLARLKTRLDELRPWPDPEFAKLPIVAWATLNKARSIAKINTTTHQVTARIGKRFDTLPDGTRDAMVLRLPSGEIIGLLGSDGVGNQVWLLQRDARDPEGTIAAFRKATGFSADEIIPVLNTPTIE